MRYVTKNDAFILSAICRSFKTIFGTVTNITVNSNNTTSKRVIVQVLWTYLPRVKLNIKRSHRRLKSNLWISFNSFVYIWIRILIEIVGIIFATGLGFSLSICDWIAFLVIFGTFGAITRLITLILLWIWVIRLDIFLSDHLDHDSEHLTLSLLLDVFLFDVIDHF